MTAPAPPTQEVILKQRESVTRCLRLVARAFGVNPGFDWPKDYCPDCGGELPNGCGCS